MDGRCSMVCALVSLTVVATSLACAGDAAAQWLAPAPEPVPTWSIPVLLRTSGLTPTPVDLRSGAPGQEARRPVYDDEGEVIPYDEIFARVDPSGARGAAWGAILGGLAGMAIGAAIGQCGGVRGGYRYYCSPREEALQAGLPLGLGLTMGFAFGWVGWNADQTTFDEALAEIRRERRVSR